MDNTLPTFEIVKTPEYIQTVQAVSDYLKDFPLSTEQNDTLVDLMVKSHLQSVQDAFKQGFETALELLTGLKKGGIQS